MSNFSFNITETAVQKIKTLDKPYLRLDIAGGGCSGFKYLFDLTDIKEEDDAVVEKDGAQVLVDLAFQEMLDGCTLDFETTMTSSRFKIVNPKAARSCGCGNSFAV